MSKDSRVIICSLPEYEDLVAEMYLSDIFIGLISQEAARGSFVIEFESSIKAKSYSLRDFLEVVNEAALKLSAVG